MKKLVFCILLIGLPAYVWGADPTITSGFIVETKAYAGREIDFHYTIENTGPGKWYTLGAQIRRVGTWQDDYDTDVDVWIPTTTGLSKMRNYEIVHYSAEGWYYVRWVIYERDNPSNINYWPSVDGQYHGLEIRNPDITSGTLNTTTAEPGDTITFNFWIDNPLPYSYTVSLGAQIRKGSGTWIDDDGGSTYPQLSPGMNYPSRNFFIPYSAVAGDYDVRWVLMELNDASNVFSDIIQYTHLRINVCECSSGVCCDGCNFYSYATPCTNDGNNCTDDYCNGSGTCIHPNNNSSCDDGLFCNGADTCSGGSCSAHTGNPCSDDGLFCNGTESCNEGTNQCVSSGNPCSDDGLFCNGIESCNEGTNQCVSSGNPCSDDGLFCNGIESCNEGTNQCMNSGNPCSETDCNTCQENTDNCFDPQGTPCSAGICDGNGNCNTEDCTDGNDNDGDGDIDCADSDCDGYVFGACDTGQLGVCADGTDKCSGGNRVCERNTDPAPNDTTCDDLDNDCDGSTDEDYTPFTCGEGVCQAESTCVVGVESCITDTPTEDPEVTCTDGLDNDCDGLTDSPDDPDCPSSCDDSDEDEICDDEDNCPQTPNGPSLGTCIEGEGTIGDLCVIDNNCGTDGVCSKNQEDTYPPPNGNGIGDACDCEANFDCDLDVDADDVAEFLNHFGRNQYFNPCTSLDLCSGDFLCDGDVDADDVTKFLEDFGRSQYFNPCPACGVGDWCEYLLTTTTTSINAGSSVYLCTEANCSSITYTLGGQTHPSTLDCDTVLSFSNVPENNYTLSASGCGYLWEIGIYVDGTSNDYYSICPEGTDLGCCEPGFGCGMSGGVYDGSFSCSECSALPSSAKAKSESTNSIRINTSQEHTSEVKAGDTEDYKFQTGLDFK